ncbi:prepilin peptidase [Peptoniphilus sp. AGMB00490]|uniref:Prepilin peptidase n=1 Tax=Peptoniphilus faecalis TaxID=2731255 RepID=A0A848RE10_9FIRM|nr:A24 family peptidase [Peptoniphilus faecalis]NMW84265.1 prepilin peptidase [Peptoniphilus faecalis]
MENNFYKITLIFLVFMLGGSFASFYYVFVNRREKKEDFIFARSHCDNCNRKLAFYEIIPVFSYIYLKGKCKSCGEKIGIDKFLTEILISILSVLNFFKYGNSLYTILFIVIITVAIFIGIIDLKTGYIYNIDLFIILVFILLLKLLAEENILNSLKFSLGIGLFFFMLYKFTEMMGLGDVYYSFIMGFFANNLLEAFNLFKDSFLIAAIFSIILILLKKKSFKDSIAFGPFISISIIIFILCR